VIKTFLCAMTFSLPAHACDVALMFGIDVSGSINADEWTLQTQGLADALLDPEIAHVIIQSEAMLSAMQWSGSVEQEFSIPWQSITGEAELAVFASKIRNLERKWLFGKTSITPALTKMRDAFTPAPPCRRLVIDFSGDGLDNGEGDLQAIRAEIGNRGITINGLAIEPQDHNSVAGYKSLDVYYRSEIIIGRGAFVQAANGYRDYPRAIRKKLLTELVTPGS
jgi:Ca-activated chloride channel family protein